MRYEVRFSKTTNVPYQMVYDAETAEEHTEVYELLPILNAQQKENKILKDCIEEYNLRIGGDIRYDEIYRDCQNKLKEFE